MIALPESYNYIAAFLTLDCGFRCNYCINHPGAPSRPQAPVVPAEAWLRYINKLNLPEDLPVTLQGGEPSRHPEFIPLILGIKAGIRLDLLTNLDFDVEKFCREIPPERFRREAPYPSIRVTYHAGQSDLNELLEKIAYMDGRGYSIGLYAIRVPGHDRLLERVAESARARGVDFRTKEFLGRRQGRVYGTYHYPKGVFADQVSSCLCRTTELLIGPDGSVFRCHRDLYAGENPIGSILDGGFQPTHEFRPCDRFGECNPCDLKQKTDRFQVGGHASVEIRFDG